MIFSGTSSSKLVRRVAPNLGSLRARRTAGGDRNRLISSAVGVFEVLETFSKNPGPLSFSQIVRYTGKPKGSIHRIVSTLSNLGLIRKQANGIEYQLTFKLWSLGTAVFAGMDLVKVAQPHIEALMNAADETAHLAVLDGPECVTYLWKSESQRSIRVQFWVGKRVPSWRSATGRSMLAFLPSVVEQLLLALKDGDTNEEDFDPQALRRTLQLVKNRGYAVTRGDNHPEMGGIAAPVRDHTGAIIAACGIAVPKFRMTQRLIRRCLPMVLRTARAISSDLGYQRSS